LLLSPMVPHVTAEAWEQRHGAGALIHAQAWPSYDPDLARDELVTMVVQVKGKVRDRIQVPPDISEEEAVALALGSARVAAELADRSPSRVVARPPRLVNIVV
jgi:leucyl-tRNA synthetase